MEKQLKEMLDKRPDELKGETLKLFKAIMKIADERDELKAKCKELEEFKKQVTEIENTNFIKYKNYIPKSLVKEKIEEIDKKEKELQNSISDEEREEYSDANISFELMDIEIRRSVLQELLEKR